MSKLAIDAYKRNQPTDPQDFGIIELREYRDSLTVRLTQVVIDRDSKTLDEVGDNLQALTNLIRDAADDARQAEQEHLQALDREWQADATFSLSDYYADLGVNRS